jgi:adenylate kinase family enzyme
MSEGVRILFLIGQPNSGKSTQAKKLAEQPLTYSVSPGDWLRELKEQGSDLGKFVFHNWSHDALTPLVTQFLDQTIGEMCNHAVQNKQVVTVVVDGFPRTLSEATAIPRIARGHPVRVVQLCVDEKVLRERGSVRDRGDDDTEKAMDIRMESYTSNISAIKAELSYQHVDHVDVEQEGLDLLALMQTISSRIVIPPTPTRKTLARRMLTETGAIERASLFQMSLRLAQSTRMSQQFFGTHPISLTKADLLRIRRYPYMVAMKATGVRFMCLIHNKHIWFISRKMEVYAGLRNDRLANFEGTLLDGELIGQEDASTYLVLDCIASKGKTCTTQPILERMCRAAGLIAFMSKGPLFFVAQEYVDRTKLVGLLRSAANLKWGVDGIIFQPKALPYRLGIDYNMFKWKPLGENTVDFYYNDPDHGLYCRQSPTARGARNNLTPVDLSSMPVISSGKMKMVRFGRLLKEFRDRCAWLRDGMIIECVALPELGAKELNVQIPMDDWGENELVWVPQLHRADKPCANIEWVAQSVIQSILDNITQEDITQQCVAPNIPQGRLSRDVSARVPHASKRNRRV